MKIVFENMDVFGRKQKKVYNIFIKGLYVLINKYINNDSFDGIEFIGGSLNTRQNKHKKATFKNIK